MNHNADINQVPHHHAHAHFYDYIEELHGHHYPSLEDQHKTTMQKLREQLLNDNNIEQSNIKD